MNSKDLALAIIHASGGDPKRADEAASIIEAQGPYAGWNFDLSAMPKEGRFEALRIYSEVFRHLPAYQTVIEPRHGRMFLPFAWRPFTENPSTKGT